MNFSINTLIHCMRMAYCIHYIFAAKIKRPNHIKHFINHLCEARRNAGNQKCLASRTSDLLTSQARVVMGFNIFFVSLIHYMYYYDICCFYGGCSHFHFVICNNCFTQRSKISEKLENVSGGQLKVW